MQRAVHRLANQTHAADGACGRLVLHHTHGFDLVAAIFAELRLHKFRIHTVPPIGHAENGNGGPFTGAGSPRNAGAGAPAALLAAAGFQSSA